MAVPVMFAAGLLALIDLIQSPGLLTQLPVYIAGFLSAALIGYLAIRWFIAYLSKQSLYLFAGYCFLIGLVMVFLI
jgi:undecaprenyl-diphosphatase